MQFTEGATVLTADGEKVGTIRQIIVDPDSTEITHLVASEGFLLPRDSLIPVGAVAETRDDETILKPGTDVLSFEAFDQRRFSPDLAGGQPVAGLGFTLYPIPGFRAAAGVETGMPATEPSVPGSSPGSASIEAGTPVVSRDGDKVGKVDEVMTRDGGAIDAIVVKSGFLWFTRRRIVPIGWIGEIQTDRVVLNVAKDQVHREARQPTTSIAQRPPGR